MPRIDNPPTTIDDSTRLCNVYKFSTILAHQSWIEEKQQVGSVNPIEKKVWEENLKKKKKFIKICKSQFVEEGI